MFRVRYASRAVLTVKVAYRSARYGWPRELLIHETRGGSRELAAVYSAAEPDASYSR